jgi:PTH1 family peptidyl-tRNA hydrolase
VIRLILGLGNPGEEYRATRHNVGFRVVEELARRWQVRLDTLECNALTARVEAAAVGAVAPSASPAKPPVCGPDGEAPATVAAGGPDAEAPATLDSAVPAAAVPEVGSVILAAPQTYMNRSGFAARCLVERHAIAPAAILAVYDEVNLPLGRLRLRRAGSPAGHRGIESILENLRSDQVARLRVGVAPAGGAVAAEELADFVLAPFAAAEHEELAPALGRAADACEVWLREGIDAAMNRFNGG